MPKLEFNRRNFLKTGLASTGILSTGAFIGCEEKRTRENNPLYRNHPLDGLIKEKIKITDVKVTLLSFELPPEEQWYLDWIPERYKCWKTDSILVEVFTDVGIKGIGGATQYGGPANVKEYIEKVIRPAIIGKNPFDIAFLTSGVLKRGPMVGWAGVDTSLFAQL